MAPSELLIIYVVRSRIGNSPRHFSSSSILQSSIGKLLGTDLSPHKVAQRNEDKPGYSRFQRDTQTGDPPSRDENCGQRRKSKNRTPRPTRSKPQRRFYPLRCSAPKRKMRNKNHLPNKNAAEERRSQHVNICRETNDSRRSPRTFPRWIPV